MPAFLKRLIFQVGDQASERTYTYTSVSNDGHYISLRPLIRPKDDKEREFPVEWAFAGLNTDIRVTKIDEYTVTQDFNFWIDINRYLKVPNIHQGEVHTTWKRWESECLEETGTVYPFGPDKEGVNFMELWQPLDSNRVEDVVAPIGMDNSKDRSVVLKIDDSKYEGLMIVVGKWAQGLMTKKGESSTDGINMIRSVETSTNSYKTLFSQGSNVDKFPSAFENLSKGTKVDVNGFEWEVIESTY
ncbi:hypothetical protein Kpol_530p48 [Vanderwaltozyma polyspora DSM 70294]|uniref:Protein HRI1 n=1 Tax=Vanderwaltozyma polyspora (strain ATCC 22028 / DSM 70294 / BCRC 21397 / CBS 2163 / NBRC 10782 / NRRL Y-8283 / UCD 57-17) TaxID=436907 RepID=HRI1_VANPO|nr:uncharacterized protein Kpol_530p48 [Vanderwaltozyma polyspora DSM 70294]A7TL22.1 RecName: Full=Protein HRI1 [Vanderwaltozyma polyspora DSM 70294]EDO17078.1 hypothetical protein Kpol_530p48 [Vanderwaltozyma polyspora DSM 70294]